MKKLLILLALLFIRVLSFAQTKADNNTYHFFQPAKLKSCDKFGENQSIDYVEIDKNIEFIVEYKVAASGDIVITILRWKTENIKNETIHIQNENSNLKYRGDKTSKDPNIYFLLPSSTFNTSCEIQPQYSSWVFGTASTILKYRPGKNGLINNKYPINSDIANDFNIGGLFGRKFTSKTNKDFAAYILAGVNYTDVKVTAQTSQDLIKNDANYGALTPELSVMLELNKIQIGLFGGIDCITGDVSKTWVYKGRPWFGIGIGFSIFKIATSSDSDQTKDKPKS